MRRLAILPALTIAALLAVGCGDKLQPEPEDTVAVVPGEKEAPHEEEARPITASFEVSSPSCVAPVARFEALVR